MQALNKRQGTSEVPKYESLVNGTISINEGIIRFFKEEKKAVHWREAFKKCKELGIVCKKQSFQAGLTKMIQAGHIKRVVSGIFQSNGQ